MTARKIVRFCICVSALVVLCSLPLKFPSNLRSQISDLQFGLTPSAEAAVPATINVQMRVDKYGQPDNGQEQMTFTIYPSATGKTGAIWSSGQVTVNVSSGALDYQLAPTGIDWRGSNGVAGFWLETMIGNNTLSPRQQLTAQVFALHSGTAENIEADTSIHFWIGASTVAFIDSSGNMTLTGTPTAANHAATKGYVDWAVSQASGTGGGYWSISGDNVYRPSGNAGIGTNSPQTTLDIESTNTVSGAWQMKIADTSQMNSGVGGGISFWGYTSGYTGLTSGAGIKTNKETNGATETGFGLGIWTHANGSAISEKLHVTGNGNVGILNTNPTYGLDVSSNARFTGTVIVSTPSLYNEAANKGYVDLVATSTGAWIPTSSGNVYRMSGYVGIDNPAPAYPLDVLGNASVSGTLLVSTPTAFDHAATKGYVDTCLSGQSAWAGISGGGICYNSGNVGIGIPSAPDQKLNVSGNISQTGIIISSGTGNNYFAGNVGIGLPNPSTALQVNGVVTATSFNGNLTGNVTGNVSGSAGSCTGNANTVDGFSTNSSYGDFSGNMIPVRNPAGYLFSNYFNMTADVGNTSSPQYLVGEWNGDNYLRYVSPSYVSVGYATTASYLNTSGLYYQGGSVGVNTTTLNHTLEVNGSANVSGAMSAGSLSSSGNINTSGKLQESGNFLIPSGVVVMWSGSTSNIPAGWHLCDGSSGTPDLRDKFIVGAGNSYSTGLTGGAASKALSVAEMPAHTHTGTTGTESATHTHLMNFRDTGNATGGGSGHVPEMTGNTLSTNTESATHTHSFTTDSSGSGQAFSILPPYYALCFIMKL
jgi:microcystin-dependent protein